MIAERHPAFGVLAYGRDGTRLWRSLRTVGCGNCDDGPQAAGLQADGTYGPIGYEGDDFWAVGRDGHVVPGCRGVVLPDGTCVAGAGSTIQPSQMSTIEAVRAGITVWRHVEPLIWWTDPPGGPPPVLGDTSGTVYGSLGDVEDSYAGSSGPQRLLALDSETGVLRWRQAHAYPVATLAHGVIAKTESGLTAFTGDGATLWQWNHQDSAKVSADPAHQRVYLDNNGLLLALDATSGLETWRSADGDPARLLSIGTSGIVYATTERNGRAGVRAIGLDGRERWEYLTATTVTGARELADGTVAVSTAAPISYIDHGVLLRINPRRSAPVVRRPRVSLSKTTFSTRCPDRFGCLGGIDNGTILRIDLPRPGTIRVRLKEPNGRPTSRTLFANLSVLAPAGTSYVRLHGADPYLAAGRHVIVVSLPDRGRTLIRRLPVTVSR